MASPTIVQSTSSSDDDEGTSHVVNLPASLTTGNLLVLLYAARASGAITWPGGYTKFGSDLADDDDPNLSTAYRKIDGTEGATITVTGPAAKSIHIVYEIAGMKDPASQAPERSTGATGLNTAPDPDSVSGTGGSKDYLFLAMHSERNLNTTTAAPTNYGNLINKKSTSGNAITGATADRALTAASDDPGVFAAGDDTSWSACTVVVHPPDAGGMLPFSRPLMTGGMDDMAGGMSH